MLFFRYSVERLHESLPELSIGYMLIEMHLRPDGRFTLAASHINADDAAHDTSRVLSILKCHVKVPLNGWVASCPTSSGLTIITVLSLLRASASLLCCVAVSTWEAFCKSPEPATVIFAGVVT